MRHQGSSVLIPQCPLSKLCCVFNTRVLLQVLGGSLYCFGSLLGFCHQWLLKVEGYPTVCIYHSFKIHSSIDKHLVACHHEYKHGVQAFLQHTDFRHRLRSINVWSNKNHGFFGFCFKELVRYFPNRLYWLTINYHQQCSRSPSSPNPSQSLPSTLVIIANIIGLCFWLHCSLCFFDLSPLIFTSYTPDKGLEFRSYKRLNIKKTNNLFKREHRTK